VDSNHRPHDYESSTGCKRRRNAVKLAQGFPAFERVAGLGMWLESPGGVRNCRRVVDVVGPPIRLPMAPKPHQASGGVRPSSNDIVCAGLRHARFHAEAGAEPLVVPRLLGRATRFDQSSFARRGDVLAAGSVIVYRREEKSRPGGQLLLSSMLSSYSVCWQMGVDDEAALAHPRSHRGRPYYPHTPLQSPSMPKRMATTPS
jgi:hypothetical protein